MESMGAGAEKEVRKGNDADYKEMERLFGWLADQPSRRWFLTEPVPAQSSAQPPAKSSGRPNRRGGDRELFYFIRMEPTTKDDPASLIHKKTYPIFL